MSSTISAEAYDLLIEKFRLPEVLNNGKPDFRLASRLANCDLRTARKAWETGWPKASLTSIKDLFALEATAARKSLKLEAANLAVKTRDEQQAAFDHAVESRKQEGEMVWVARQATLANLRTARELSDAARQLGPVLRHMVEFDIGVAQRWLEYEERFTSGDETAEPPLVARPAMTLQDGLKLLTALSELTNKIVDTAKKAMDMERLYLGSPGDQEKNNNPTKDMSLHEVQARAEAVKNAAAHFEQKSGLRVIAGGLKTTVGEAFNG